MAADRKTSTRRRIGILVLVCLVVTLVLGNHLFARWAPPVVGAVELVEKDPSVAAVVGSPASVSLTVARRLERNLLHAISGQDSVSVLSTVKGPKGEATIRLSARNIDGQGWAGDFAVEGQAKSVLKDGSYVTEGEGTLLAGDFAPDGASRVKSN